MKFITDLLPATFQNSWCIAGGYAACPALAADIDVWIYNQGGAGTLAEARQTILEHLELRLAGYKHAWQQPFEVTERAGHVVRHADDERYSNFEVNIEKVAKVVPQGDYRHIKPIHIMVVDAPNPGVLISAFDLSVHAVAIDSDGRIWQADEFTAPTVAIRLMKQANAKTPARYDRLCVRYNQVPTVEHFPNAEETVGAI